MYAFASCQVTQTTGSRSVCSKPGWSHVTPGSFSHLAPSCPQPSAGLNPVAFTNAANSPRVTSYLPMAKGRSVTVCFGDSSETDPSVAPCAAAQDCSAESDPMLYVPPGRGTISGQSGQSRK